MNECVIIFYDCLFIQIKIMFLLCVVLFKPPKIYILKNSVIYLKKNSELFILKKSESDKKKNKIK